MISDIKRKSLPAIARAVGLHDAQPLQNFVTNSPWSAIELRQRRLELTKKMLKVRPFKLVIDETGDKKKGKSTDYVARQYIGNLGKVDNGIVSVNAYGVLGELTFPLMFKAFKPRKNLKEKDQYKTKPQLAVEIIEELIENGFCFDLVLADSLYGSSATFLAVLDKYHLDYVLAIRRNHPEFTRGIQQVTYGSWQVFERIFTDGTQETRYIQQITEAQHNPVTYWRITTNPDTLPKNQTWYVSTNLQGDIAACLGNLYGFRNWVEYAFKQGKNELGWADFRLTDYKQIEKWWELVMSAYLMVSLQAQARVDAFTNNHLPSARVDASTNNHLPELSQEPPEFSQHKWWDFHKGWKSTLNNLRLIVQPYIFFNLINPWLAVFDIQCLRFGFRFLIDILNEFRGYMPINSG